MVTYRPSKRSDAEYIGRHLREADRLEVEATGVRGQDAALLSYMDSEICHTACSDGVPCMIFGVSKPIFSEEGYVWALGTDECARHPIEMVRFGRKYLRAFLEVCPCLVNWCDARYEKAHRWLRAIGFAIEEPAPYGVKGAMFCKLTARKGV